MRNLAGLLFAVGVVIIATFLFAISIGQHIPIEFRNARLSWFFYRFIFFAAPLAPLLTLFHTTRKSRDFNRRLRTVLFTLGICVLLGFVTYDRFYNVGFGFWTTFRYAYEHRQNPAVTIAEQRYDAGAFGYGGARNVKLCPWLPGFYKVSEIDTSKLDPLEWKPIDREGDVKFP